MAQEIQKEIEAGTTGIIITHGTDTVHYTAAALEFMIESPVPIILVCAQRSSDRGSTDAEMNLLNALYFITHSDFSQVGLCMHKDENDEVAWILPATKCRKMHTSRRDAFRPINTTPWAEVNYRKKNISFLQNNYKKTGTPFSMKLFNPKVKVGILFQRTHMFAKEFSSFNRYDGLVIMSTGLGNLPIIETDPSTKENTAIAKAIKSLVKGGTVVALAPQTIYGRLHQHVYSNEPIQQEMGILAHLSDMTPETTYLKLAWLLSNYSKDDAKKLLLENLRGEITERTGESTFLL